MIFFKYKTAIFNLFFLIILSDTHAQQYHVFRKDQMFFGMLGGVNFTQTRIKEKHNVLVSLDTPSEDYEKKYDKMFKNGGTQFGGYFSYSFDRHLSLVIQPSYQTNRFNYLTSFQWIDTVNNINFSQEMKHVQKISNFSFPILAKWDFTTNQLSPYAQLGIFTEFRHKVYKTIFYDGLIDERVDEKEADGISNNVLVNEHFNKFNFGIISGVGVSFYAKYFTIGLETNYRFGLKKIVNDHNRYADVSGFTAQYLDVFDQFKLSNLNFQFTFLLPIDNSLSLNVLRRSKY